MIQRRVQPLKPMPTAPGRHSGGVGWLGLATSLLLHAAVLGALWALAAGGSGESGTMGADFQTEDPAPTFHILPARPKAAKVAPRKEQALPAQLNRIAAESSTSDILLAKLPPPKAYVPIDVEAAVEKLHEARQRTDRTANLTKATQPSAVASTSTGKGKAQRRQTQGTGTKAEGGSGSGSGSGVGRGNGPQIIHSYPATYPPEAKTSGHQGSALVQVILTAGGHVQTCSIHKSTGNRELDSAALTAVRGWTFSRNYPGTAVLVRVGFKIT